MFGAGLRAFAGMSPFEIKDELIRLAGSAGHGPARVFLDAGRGNPNWIATRARAAFFQLGRFALEEAARTMRHPAGLAGMPRRDGIAARLDAWLDPDTKSLLAAAAPLGCQGDAFVHELVNAIAGDTYPVPDRMLPHAETIVGEYVLRTLCGDRRPPGRVDLFATEGATAAICYVLRSLHANRLLRPGDRIALGTPIFTPYLELPGLEDFDLEPVHIEATAANGFQYTAAALRPLEDPRVKAFFLVNPGNPTAMALGAPARRRIADIVRRRPDLMILTDDVYATFVPGFRSLFADLPRNTIAVYSFSKYFGATGWRLGAIALHSDNVFDHAIAALPEAEKAALSRRYAPLAPDPGNLRFIERLVADSRDVALRHTAGLSPPQQAMMTLFALSDLADDAQSYRAACRALLRRREHAFAAALGTSPAHSPLATRYYGLIDLGDWLEKEVGPAARRFLQRNVHPLDIVFRLAREHGLVVLNGGGFHAPDWSARVSFANLDEDSYAMIGRAIRAIAAEYLASYRNQIKHRLRRLTNP
jgi:aspartate 4-decarboxylase